MESIRCGIFNARYLNKVSPLLRLRIIAAQVQCCTFFLALLNVSHDLVILCLAIVRSLIGLSAEIVANSNPAVEYH